MATSSTRRISLNSPVSSSRSQDTTALVAKLLARENVNVVHRRGAQTASFDGVSRTLTLPIWQDMSEDLVDMLVAHETGHALHTPAGESPILSAIRDISTDEAQFSTAKMYINVVEDIRIEKMIKDEFPGVKRAFAKGYRELLDRNFFEVDSIPMEKRTLADRINLHAKVGHLIPVPFSDYERGILAMCENARSWQEVVEAAKEAYEYDGTRGGNDEKMMQASPGNDGEDGENRDSVEVETNANGSSKNSDGSDENKAKPQGSDEKTDSETDETVGNSDSDKSGDENSENTQGKISNPDPRSYDAPEFSPPSAPASADAMERNLSENTSSKQNRGPDRAYGNLPTLKDPNRAILDYREIRTICGILENDFTNSTDSQILDEACRRMVVNTNRQVNVMAREFERRRSALASRRESRAVSGSRLDVNRLHAYRYSDEIFRAMTTRRDGKSHGLVMFVDWSGSMSGVLGDTVNQAILLATFCRKVRIPFEIYGFSSVDPREIRNALRVSQAFPNSPTGIEDYDENTTMWSRNPEDLDAHQLTLLNLLSSRMNRAAFNAALRDLMHLSHRFGGNQFVTEAHADATNSELGSYSAFSRARGLFGLKTTNCQQLSYQLALGSTPLNSCAVAAFTLLPRFRAANRTQILTAIFLTDGGASDSIMSGKWNGEGQRESFYGMHPYGHDVWMQTPRNRKGYVVVQNSSQRTLTANLLRALSAETGCRILGFDILHASWRGFRNNYSATRWFPRDYTNGESLSDHKERLTALTEQGKKDNFLRVTGENALNEGYDEVYLFMSSTLSAKSDDMMSNLNSDATITRIRNAYMKQQAANSVNRVFVTRFVEQIATEM